MSTNLVKYLSTGMILASLAATPLVFAQNSSGTNSNSNSNSANASIQKGWAKQKSQAPSFNQELTIKTINGTTLTGTNKDGITYTVDISNAREPKKMDNLNLPAMAVGDQVQVVGDLNGTTVTAKMTRDITLMEKYGPTGGNVTAINGNTFTILNNRDNVSYTVTVDGNTKYTGTDSHALKSISDLKVGYHVMVLGSKDSTAKTVIATDVKIPAMEGRGKHGIGRGERGMGMGKNCNNNQNATTTTTNS